MTKRGSADVSFFLIAGLDVTGTLTEFEDRREARTEESHGMGDNWVKHSFVHTREGEITQSGFYDDAAGSIHDALSTGPGATNILCYCLEGTATGAQFVGWSGGVQVTYTRQAQRDALTKAQAAYRPSGTIEQGKVLRTYGPVAATGLSSANMVDFGASSTGVAGYLQYNASAGEANVRIKQSPDGNAWSDLFVFARTASGHGAERQETTAFAQRYTCVDITTATATGAITALNCMVGLVRGLA